VQVKINPEFTSHKLNKAIMTQLVKLYRETELGMRLPVYDGGRNLYTAGLLPFTTKDFIIVLCDDDEGACYTRLSINHIYIYICIYETYCVLN
jgi:eukaryotic translation initiation factor 2C